MQGGGVYIPPLSTKEKKLTINKLLKILTKLIYATLIVVKISHNNVI